jgi:adenylate cyclase
MPKDPNINSIKDEVVHNQQIIEELNANLSRKTQEVRIVQKIAAEINSTIDLDKVLQIILQSMDEVFGFNHSMILLFDLQDNLLKVVASRGYEKSGLGAEVALGQGVIGVVAKRKKMMRMGNIGTQMSYLSAVRTRVEAAGRSDQLQEKVQLPGLPNVQSQVAIPLMVKENLIGVFAVESAEPNIFAERDEVLITILANQAASAIQNARLYKEEADRKMELKKAYEKQVQLNREVVRQSEEIQRVNRLRRFFSPQIVESITSDHKMDEIFQDHVREITVVFLDLRNFTSFAQKAEPLELIHTIRDFHQAVGTIIHRYNGTLERFTGDGLMVFLGDPDPMPDHPLRALKMCTDLRKEVQSLQTTWVERGYDLSLGMGIASGLAALGTIGFEGRIDYAALGTVTNLASRICGEAEGGHILASETTYEHAKKQIPMEFYEEIPLKGFSQAQKVYRVI